MEVELQAFLILALDGCEWPFSRYGLISPRTHWLGGWVVASRAGLDAAAKRDAAMPSPPLPEIEPR